MFYDYFETGLIGTLTLVGDEEGLRHIVFPKEKNPIIIQERLEEAARVLCTGQSSIAGLFQG